MTQSVKESLADAETLRLALAEANDPAANPPDAFRIRPSRHGFPSMAAYRARRAAHAAFRAVPGLRG